MMFDRLSKQLIMANLVKAFKSYYTWVWQLDIRLRRQLVYEMSPHSIQYLTLRVSGAETITNPR